GIQHADDLGRLVGDNRLFLPVPEHRHGDAARIVGCSLGIDLAKIVETVERIAGGAFLGKECPAFLAHEMVDDRNRDDILELLQLAKDQRPMRPWAGERYIEMITPRLGLEAAAASFRRRPVKRYPVSPMGLGADKFAAGFLGI